jgi:hypothetical protein
MTRDEYIFRIKSDVRDTAGKLTDPEDFEAALDDALARYGDLRPLAMTSPIVGDGSAAYPLPPEFSQGYSVIQQVARAEGQALTDVLDPETYRVAPGITGPVLAFDDALVIGDTVYVTFTASPMLDDTTDTVAPVDRPAVVKFGAAFACLKLAAHYAQTSEPTLGADVISYGERASTYLRMSDEYRQTANRHFGISDAEPEVEAASAAGDLDVTGGEGQPRMFHGGGSR